MNDEWGLPGYVPKKRQGIVSPMQPIKEPKMDTILRNKLYMQNIKDVI